MKKSIPILCAVCHTMQASKIEIKEAPNAPAVPKKK
jgi:hypothetical protein